MLTIEQNEKYYPFIANLRFKKFLKGVINVFLGFSLTVQFGMHAFRWRAILCIAVDDKLDFNPLNFPILAPIPYITVLQLYTEDNFSKTTKFDYAIILLLSIPIFNTK